MPKQLHDLALLREAAEAAGPKAARALVALLEEYVTTYDALDEVRAQSARMLCTAERIEAQSHEADATIARYRVAAAALVTCLRERQRRDPFRLAPELHGLRRAEDLAIRQFHALDQMTVTAAALGARAQCAQEVGHA